MRWIGLLPTPPELLSEITRSALERLLTSTHLSIDDEQLRAVMPTARDDEQEVGP